MFQYLKKLHQVIAIIINIIKQLVNIIPEGSYGQGTIEETIKDTIEWMVNKHQ
jgi:hypothetical protein